MMNSTLTGRVTVDVSTPSGQTCTIAALAAGRVDQLHGAIERVLKIPRVVQRLIFAGREIYSEQFLAQLHVENGSNITVINSWPQNPASIVEKLHFAASSPPTHCLAAAVAQCLEHEEWSVKVAALGALSWMGQVAVPHAGAIARLLSDDRRGVRSAAAESLSWMEEAGAKYAGEMLAFAGEFRQNYFRVFALMRTPKDAVNTFFQSELPNTRLAATKSVVRLLEERDWRPRSTVEKLHLQRFLLPYLFQAFFDPFEDVRTTVAEYLLSCIPTFDSGEKRRIKREMGIAPRPSCKKCAESKVQILEEELIFRFMLFGEDVNLDTATLKDDEVSTAACKEIAKRLDSHWPQWAGWQEGLDDPDTSVEAAACQVSVAMVHYLRRRFCEWQRDQGQGQRVCEDRGPANWHLHSLRGLLSVMVETGLTSHRWQVRQAVVESLILLEPFGKYAVIAVRSAKEKEKEKQVLETMTRFFAKYGDEPSDDTCQLFHFDDGCDWSACCSEDSEDLLQLHDKGGGYSKSHLSRSARRNKKHGVDSANGPSTIARQKKWERRNARAQGAENFSDSKRKSQREKEQDRQLKTAMLGHELLRFAIEDDEDA